MADAAPAPTAADKAVAAAQPDAAHPKSFAVFVTVEIHEDRLEDFLNVMKEDQIESPKEEKCLHFDVLRSGDAATPNVFHFYEIYTEQNGHAEHRETAHYKKWTAFKESGGVKNQTAVKMNGVFMHRLQG